MPVRRRGRRGAAAPRGNRRVLSGTPTCPPSGPGSATATGCTGRGRPNTVSDATRPSCSSIPTRRPSKARSTGTRRASPTRSATRTRATTTTAPPSCPGPWCTTPIFDWGNDRPPDVELNESVIYEVHVKGFTARHPEVPEAQRGTYSGPGPSRGHRVPHRARGDRRGTPARAPVRPRRPPHRAGAAQLLGLQLDRVPGPAQRVRRHRPAGRAGRRVQGDGPRAARGGHRGDPRRRLQPHRRGQPPGTRLVDEGHRQRGLLPSRSGEPPVLLRHHGHREQPQRASSAHPPADHGLAALLGDRDARRRVPLRPGRQPGPPVPRGGPAVRILRPDPAGSRGLPGQAHRRAVGHRRGRLPGRQLPRPVVGVERPLPRHGARLLAG